MPEPVTLEELKNFARVSADDDDALIVGLGVSAREFIEQATGRDFSSDGANVPEKARLTIKALVAFWYDFRTPVTEGQVTRVPNHVRSLIAQLRGGRLEPDAVSE